MSQGMLPIRLIAHVLFGEPVPLRRDMRKAQKKGAPIARPLVCADRDPARGRSLNHYGGAGKGTRRGPVAMFCRSARASVSGPFRRAGGLWRFGCPADACGVRPAKPRTVIGDDRDSGGLVPQAGTTVLSIIDLAGDSVDWALLSTRQINASVSFPSGGNNLVMRGGVALGKL